MHDPSEPGRNAPYTVKCRGVSTEHKKAFEALRVDLGGATNGEILETLLEVYESEPRLVLDQHDRF